jgi:metal-responsive CopG/Arc/MetJ family transcriptional regulator
MSSGKIAISIDSEALQKVDRLGQRGVFPNRSKLFQVAVFEKLARLDKQRLSQECAKLRPGEERAAAEERFAGETDWPAY